MPDPLDMSPDAARSQINDPVLDPTGIGPVMEITGMAFQIMTGARVAGFSPDQAFQLARDWFITMTKMSAERDG